jgi:hypothetical protein
MCCVDQAIIAGDVLAGGRCNQGMLGRFFVHDIAASAHIAQSLCRLWWLSCCCTELPLQCASRCSFQSPLTCIETATLSRIVADAILSSGVCLLHAKGPTGSCPAMHSRASCMPPHTPTGHGQCPFAKHLCACRLLSTSPHAVGFRAAHHQYLACMLCYATVCSNCVVLCVITRGGVEQLGSGASSGRCATHLSLSSSHVPYSKGRRLRFLRWSRWCDGVCKHVCCARGKLFAERKLDCRCVVCHVRCERTYRELDDVHPYRLGSTRFWAGPVRKGLHAPAHTHKGVATRGMHSQSVIMPAALTDWGLLQADAGELANVL